MVQEQSNAKAYNTTTFEKNRENQQTGHNMKETLLARMCCIGRRSEQLILGQEYQPTIRPYLVKGIKRMR
jgi:hypothetical protein